MAQEGVASLHVRSGEKKIATGTFINTSTWTGEESSTLIWEPEVIGHQMRNLSLHGKIWERKKQKVSSTFTY